MILATKDLSQLTQQISSNPVPPIKIEIYYTCPIHTPTTMTTQPTTQLIPPHTIHPSWREWDDRPYFGFDLDAIYSREDVYPPREQVFRVFEMDVRDIRLVLLGQDPYHQQGQAHGWSFSVPTGIKPPPSLKNIYKEIQRSFPERNYAQSSFESGNLEEWVHREKIFLLNSSLTVQKGRAGSDIRIWEAFTDRVIEYISEQNPSCVFLLLGNYAKSKRKFIRNAERIVEEVHPSPLARGFVGSDVFKRVERALGHEVNWCPAPFSPIT